MKRKSSEIIMKKYRPFKFLLQIPVPWVFILIYLIGVLFHFIFPIKILPGETISLVKIIGIVLFATGAIIAGRSLLIFRKAHTTTTPGEQSVQLIEEGSYRVTRNPMYLSLTLAYLGEAGILNQIWPVILLPFLLSYVNWVVVPLEEKILGEDYKDEYRSYCRRVHRWL